MTNVCSLPAPPSLAWQPSLLDIAARPPQFDATFATAVRHELGRSSWVEHVPGWVLGAAELFELVLTEAPWTTRTVPMFGRMVEEPRLSAWYGADFADASLPPIAPAMAAALSERYRREFDSVGAALYRDGRDSVAWHSDRVDPALIEPVVALISLGSPRALRMRGAHAGRGNPQHSRRFVLLPGDLFVMGGDTQRDWQHSIPKVAKAGPRLSLQFRHSR